MMYDIIINQLKGITENSVQTLGSATLEMQIGTKRYPAEFRVAHNDLSVLNEGILVEPFIIGRKTIFNYQTKELI